MDWVGSSLVLAGALAAAGIGYWQWKRVERRKSRSQFNNARATALDTVIKKLEDLEIKSRAKDISQTELEQEVARMNELLIKNRSTLTEEDGVNAHIYLNAVTEIHKVISNAPPSTRESWAWTWAVFEDDDVVSYYFNKLRSIELSSKRAIEELGE
jgi:hypothetical protein